MKNQGFLLFITASLHAQLINNLPTQPPRINPDLSVTYFLNAPKANEVRLVDSTHSPGPPGLPLTRDFDGIWSVTTPPYEAGTHSYAFIVDGVLTGNLFSTAAAERLPRPNVLFELLEVRGSESLLTDIQAVPHGTVHVETFTSEKLNRQVRVFVYTPPDFSAGEELPIVYLLHGASTDERAWSQIGYAERITDNLIFTREVRRVIVAMPDTSGPNRSNLPWELVEPYLISEVFPFVEGKYFAPANPAGGVRARQPEVKRYLAGFSAGANHARFTGLRNPSLFAGLGMFSGGGLAMGSLADIHPPVSRPKLFRHMKVVYFAIGTQDPALPNVQRISEQLRQLGIDNELRITSGGHTWFNWRRYLAEFLSRTVNPQ